MRLGPDISFSGTSLAHIYTYTYTLYEGDNPYKDETVNITIPALRRYKTRQTYV